LLDKWYQKNRAQVQVGLRFFDVSNCDLFPYALLEQLQEINDTEILVQNINRYISEKD